ncbi:MAG: tetratricopeptide repeat protein [Desulfobacterales bacterium]|jgi:tetratricopeptide (TPR) repeat protein
MSFLKIFSGKTPEAHEQKGDELFAHELWGKAKVEYERALGKLEKTVPQNDSLRSRLQEKIQRTKASLAHRHKHNADEMLEAGFYHDARELYTLALELSEDVKLKADLTEKLEQLDFQMSKEVEETLVDYDTDDEQDGGRQFIEPSGQGDEYFTALCGALPADVQKAYGSYGDNFKKGYLALNQGDFIVAADFLSRAMEENPTTDSYIPLELATAYLNLQKHSQAQQLLETFVENQPQALPAYQLLCEIYWETGAFEQAEALLNSVPGELKESVAVFILKGETMFHAGNYSGAKEWYQDFFKTYSWNEAVARALAKAHEALNEFANARNLYRKIMDECRSCHARIDPVIKQRYADLCFDSGMLNTDILDLYLSLAQERPDKAAEYYEKVSRIYADQGNPTEAARFRAIAEKIAQRQ